MKTTNLLFFIVLLLCFVSCLDTDVDDNVRVLVKGKIVDQDNSPVMGAKINVYTDANNSISNAVLLGEGLSNVNGEFEITSLFGSNTLFYTTVELNDAYSSYRYRTNTSEFRPENLVFDLQTVELRQLSTFEYSIVRETEENSTLNYSIRYIDPFCLEVFEDGVLNEFQSLCYFESILNRSLDNNIPSVQNAQLRVPLGSSIEFSYSINDGDQIVEVFNINSTSIDVQFTY